MANHMTWGLPLRCLLFQLLTLELCCRSCKSCLRRTTRCQGDSKVKWLFDSSMLWWLALLSSSSVASFSFALLVTSNEEHPSFVFSNRALALKAFKASLVPSHFNLAIREVLRASHLRTFDPGNFRASNIQAPPALLVGWVLMGGQNPRRLSKPDKRTKRKMPSAILVAHLRSRVSRICSPVLHVLCQVKSRFTERSKSWESQADQSAPYTSNTMQDNLSEVRNIFHHDYSYGYDHLRNVSFGPKHSFWEWSLLRTPGLLDADALLPALHWVAQLPHEGRLVRWFIAVFIRFSMGAHPCFAKTFLILIWDMFAMSLPTSMTGNVVWVSKLGTSQTYSSPLSNYPFWLESSWIPTL